MQSSCNSEVVNSFDMFTSASNIRSIPWKSKDFNILEWNAGGLYQAKKTDLRETLLTFDIDVIAIMKVNLTEEQLKFPQSLGYVTYLLSKFRQIASGIFVGIK
ncbi:hypothetical protein NPIL_227281 [Nephila pilipes]|uniref:Uncharacterized protein n=1 Tax=Nephila pilipes TaxID=299642 RepID=A0A8X6MTY1_NEPPI|nr:hypothetical protein NPIL_227281 [Nephila pilipes]